MTTFLRKDGLMSALAVAILVIGTATGSAITMLAMSVIALPFAAVLYRKQLGDGFLLIATVAMATAFVIGLVISR